MSTVSRTIATAVAALLLVGALASCGPDTPEGDPSSSPAADDTAAATPSPTPIEPSEQPTEPDPPAAEPPTCENIVPQSRLDFIAAQGWTLFPPTDFFAKLRSEGFDYPELRFEDNGDIVCPWTAGDHVVYAYGYSPLPAEQVDAASAQLLAGDPFVESDFAAGRLFTSQVDDSPYHLYWIDLDGSWYVASDAQVLDELRSQNP